jgi:hypothetical protein
MKRQMSFAEAESAGKMRVTRRQRFLGDFPDVEEAPDPAMQPTNDGKPHPNWHSVDSLNASQATLTR